MTQQEIIDRISEGSFDYENGSLEFSCLRLELSLRMGDTYEGSFHVYASGGSLVEGDVYSDHLRMECLTEHFNGTDAEIFYCFHAENMEEGDISKGAFTVISNCGEYSLPFVVTIEHEVLGSSLGVIRNMFHFTNLAKSSWREAVRMFYSPGFASLFQGTDAGLYDLYLALSAKEGNEQNLEEFLICSNKKQQLEFLTREKELRITLTGNEGNLGVSEHDISILRNGWGYTQLYIECEGDFFFTEKEQLTEDDFIGNRYTLPVFIDGNVCRRGRQFGKIYIYNAYTSLELPVIVTVGETSLTGRMRRSRRQLMTELSELYVKFRMHRISKNVWTSESARIIDRMAAMDEKDVMARLFQAQVLLTQERYNEAGWILDHVEDLLEQRAEDDSDAYAYYLYLTTLARRDPQYTAQIAEEVERLYRADRTRWKTGWLLLYLSEEYNRSAAEKWTFLEKQVRNGCSSPIVYVEALALMNRNPALLRRLGEFEEQVLLFGARWEGITDALLEQLLYLTGKKRDYSVLLYRTLTTLYQTRPEVRILQEICSLLMKGARTKQGAFAWYALGVKSHLRLTNLYEYYMAALDPTAEVELPKVILMYFSYQNHLDWEKSAYLYAYLLAHRGEYEELYETYAPRIERFVTEQIRSCRINRSLAELYQAFLTPAFFEEHAKARGGESADLLEPLSKLLFAHQVRCSDTRIRSVIVYQPHNLVPAVYLLADGSTWITIYGNAYTIVFEDAYGNRFYNSVEYTLEKLMLSGKFLRLFNHYIPKDVALDLYLVGVSKNEEGHSPEQLARQARIAASDAVEPQYAREMAVKLLMDYYEADDLDALDERLAHFSCKGLSAEQRLPILQLMVQRRFYDRAYEWICAFTPYDVDPKLLLRLTDLWIEQKDASKEQILYATARSVFRRGKYNSLLLKYLMHTYTGSTRELRDIRKAAMSFELDCYEISEKLLTQMLYTGAFIGEKAEILKYFIAQGGRQSLINAVLTQEAYEAFCGEKLTDETIFREIAACTQRGEKLPVVCKLAYLKYYAEHPGEEHSPLLRSFLSEMLQRGIHLNFFRELKGCEDLLIEQQDKQIIEYRTRSDVRAKIYYVLLGENGAASDYTSEYMSEAYHGVFFKEFILFFGEELQYYIMEESPSQEQLTESGSLRKNEIISGQAQDRFELINDCMIGHTLQDDGTLLHLLEEYDTKDYFERNLFTLR